MKTLVLYYSRGGKTERVANDIASRLGADIEKIIDKKSRSGLFGFLFGGRDAMKERETEIGEPIKNAIDYDLVIFGTPVWASNITPAIRTYINKTKNNLKNTAFFITSGNTNSETIVRIMEKLVEKKMKTHVGFSANELRNKELYNKKITTFIESIKS
jgi:flavodoxin